VPVARDRPPAVPFRRGQEDGFPVAVFRRESRAPVHLPTMHAHRFFSALYADGGEGALVLPRQRIDMAAGDFHLVGPGEPHHTGDLATVVGWVLEFTADVLAQPEAEALSGYFGSGCGRPRWFAYLRGGRFGVPKVTVPEAMRPRFDARFRALAAELEGRSFAYQDAVRAELSLLLVDLTRLSVPAGAPAKIAPLVAEVFAVIDARFAEPLSLKHVARAVGRSPSHVTHVVREQTGLTVLEWIQERRLDEARRRLRDTDEDVAIVAERVGVGSVNHFIRLFQRAHGLSPGVWRRSTTGVQMVDR
jgi:AraC family transcriptional activator of pobA